MTCCFHYLRCKFPKSRHPHHLLKHIFAYYWNWDNKANLEYFITCPAQRNTSWIVSFLPALRNISWQFFWDKIWTSTSCKTVGVMIFECFVLPHPVRNLTQFVSYKPSYGKQSTTWIFIELVPTTLAVRPSKVCLYLGRQTGTMCSLYCTGFVNFSNAISFLKSAGLYPGWTFQVK